MAISKIPGKGTQDLFNNISDAGTEGTKVAAGTNAQRGTTTGQWRYNSDTGFFEGRGASEFSSLEPTPTVASVDVTEVDSQAGGNQTIVVTGTNFTTGGTISFRGSSANFNASTTTFNNSTQITAVAPKASFLNAQEPYTVRFTASTGTFGQSGTGLISVDTSPTWSTSSGQIGGEIYETDTVNTSATATDADGDTIAYTVQSGSLPGGTSLNSGTGAITGTAGAVGSDTTSNFTLRATAGSKTVDRAFSIVVKNDLTNVVDYFGDNSGKSLFRFDNNGTDEGGIDNISYGHPGTYGGSAGNVSYNTSTKKLGTHSLLKLSGGHYGYTSVRNYTNFSVTGWHNSTNLGQGDRFFQGLFGNQNTGEILTSEKTTPSSAYYFALQCGSFSNGNGQSGDKYIANATGCPTISNGTWFHFAWTRDGTDTRIYVNGVLGNTITENIGSISLNPTSPTALYLGTASTQLGNTTYDTAGYYDHFRIFNKKLSQSEITSMYNFESTR